MLGCLLPDLHQWPGIWLKSFCEDQISQEISNGEKIRILILPFLSWGAIARTRLSYPISKELGVPDWMLPRRPPCLYSAHISCLAVQVSLYLLSCKVQAELIPRLHTVHGFTKVVSKSWHREKTWTFHQEEKKCFSSPTEKKHQIDAKKVFLYSTFSPSIMSVWTLTKYPTHRPVKNLQKKKYFSVF